MKNKWELETLLDNFLAWLDKLYKVQRNDWIDNAFDDFREKWAWDIDKLTSIKELEAHARKSFRQAIEDNMPTDDEPNYIKPVKFKH